MPPRAFVGLLFASYSGTTFLLPLFFFSKLQSSVLVGVFLKGAGIFPQGIGREINSGRIQLRASTRSTIPSVFSRFTEPPKGLTPRLL